MVTTSHVYFVLVDVDGGTVGRTGGEQVCLALCDHLCVSDNEAVHFGEGLDRVAVSGTSDHEGSLVQGLHCLGEHQIVHLSDLDPASTWDQLEEDLAFELVSALERVLKSVGSLLDGRLDNVGDDDTVIT